MCGIVGYLGSKSAYPVLINGLRRLEYRGYDSAGVAICRGGIKLVKRKGPVDELDAAAQKASLNGTVGIAHTRWATHGEPSEINAHPHLSADGRIAIVHNGIIENYLDIKEKLEEKGIEFKSQTDTEVLANLIAVILSEQKVSCRDAILAAINQVRGAYAIVVLDANDPDMLVVAKKSSPLAIGIAGKDFVVGSDATPIVGHANKVIYLNDDEVAELRRGGEYKIISAASGEVLPHIQNLELEIDKLEKGGFSHFMLKEIHEQPMVIAETMRGRLSHDHAITQLGGIADYEQRILRAPKLTIVACGTSLHAGLVGKYLIEELAGIPVEVDYASEFRYRKPPISNNDVVLAISQSGETADTLAATQMAKEAGALALGIVNVVGSSIARATNAGIYTHAGPEVSVASTKAFTTQVTVLTLMALRLSQQLGVKSRAELQEIYRQMALLPAWVEQSLKSENKAKEVAVEIAHSKVVLFLGRGVNYPVSLEGALKLKEISYIPAEGYPAGEMKHGPIALIEKGTPVIVVVPSDPQAKEKVLSNIQEVQARGAKVIAVSSTDIGESADALLQIPEVPEIFSPCVTAIPLQLLAYYVALELGKNVDKPRNLAKSVTVE